MFWCADSICGSCHLVVTDYGDEVEFELRTLDDREFIESALLNKEEALELVQFLKD
ncbi:hypothetical protein UFOVP67_65 [uncultured Caudovirales phage]|uniref:Uncharacterized protein n=1 Tax=uncultured Caudovirales phage TaxID=2100421 RepID=A0A6J5T9D7_9CAUD|nr:hypothetical protein UFOVP67_65 [uncultured Caudovirales phage]